MTRRLLAAAALVAAFGPFAATPANAATCSPVLDYVARNLPAPAHDAYTKVCGV
jgi:hypothetical protein